MATYLVALPARRVVCDCQAVDSNGNLDAAYSGAVTFSISGLGTFGDDLASGSARQTINITESGIYEATLVTSGDSLAFGSSAFVSVQAGTGAVLSLSADVAVSACPLHGVLPADASAGLALCAR